MGLKAELATMGRAVQHEVRPELQGRLAHVSFTLPYSQPVHIMGVYAPSGGGAPGNAPHCRTTLQNAIHSALLGHREQHATVLLVGDWNATLQAADRTANATYDYDLQHRTFLRTAELEPLDPPSQGASRAHTFHAADGSGSRIDDIYVASRSAHLARSSSVEVRPRLATGDHSPLLASIPAAALRLVMPSSVPPPPRAPRTVLSLPVSKADQERFRDAVLDPSCCGRDIAELHERVTNILQTDVATHHARQEASEAGSKQRATLQTIGGATAADTVGQLANELDTILQKCLRTALTVCTTKTTNPDGQHHAPRTEARKRTAIESKLQALHYAQQHTAGHELSVRELADSLQATTPAPLQDAAHAAAAALTCSLAASDSCASASATLRQHIKDTKGELTRMDQERAKQAKAQSDKALQRLLAKQPKQGHRKILAPSDGPAMPPLHALARPTGPHPHRP